MCEIEGSGMNVCIDFVKSMKKDNVFFTYSQKLSFL